MSTAAPPRPPPRPWGATSSEGSNEPKEMDESQRTSMSRSSLRKTLLERKASLTGYEVQFLEQLCDNGDEIEVQLAHETLMDSKLFFDGESIESTPQPDEGIAASHNHVDLFSSLRSLESDHMESSQRRLEVLEERKRRLSLGHMFRAHNNGLAFSTQGSRRSLIARRSSLSSVGSRPEHYFSTATDSIFRGPGEKAMKDISKDYNRRVSWTAEAKNAMNGATQSILRTPVRHALRRMESEGSRKSVSFSREMPMPKQSPFGGRIASTGCIRKSKNPYERSTSMPTIPFSLDSSESSYTAPSLHHGRRLSSSSIQSSISIPSLHIAQPIWSPNASLRSSNSTPSIHMANRIHSMSQNSAWSSFAGSVTSSANVDVGDFAEEKKTDTWSLPVPAKVEIFQQESEGRQIEPATKLLTHDDESTQRGRLVFMRRASRNKDKGEGIEVCDVQPGSLVSYGDNSVSASLRSSYSFDETMSFGKISTIFRQKLTRSLSDDIVNAIFLGGARKLVRESSTLKDVDPIDPDDDDSYNIDDETSLNYFDSWKVIEDEYENGYGGGGTLPFRIFGTSGDDEAALPHVLSPPLMASLQAFLPQRVSGENFWMKYSLVRDGASLITFLQHARGATYSILAIETIDGEVFGAFTTEPWRKNWNFFGGDESFLWRMRHSRKERSHSIIDQAKMESEIEVFPFSGQNTCIQLCTHDRLAVGGGAGGPMEVDASKASPKQHEYGFGLSIGSNLLHGTSSPCITFSSPALCLAHSDGSPFEIMNMELWTLSPCMNLEDAQKLELGQLFLGKHGRAY